MSLDINHLEAESFIKIKSDPTKINNANLSVEIDDEFMQCIEHYYHTNEKVVLHKTQIYDSETIEYDIIPIDLYKLLCAQAYKHAEPGIIFTNRFRNYNLMELDSDYSIETCNPCGEQPLASGAACLLGAINLSAYVLNPFTEKVQFDFDSLYKDLFIYYKSLDELIDKGLPYHALEEQKLMASNYRNIGLGTMGWADVFIKFGLKYGDKNSQKLTHQISKFLATRCLEINQILGRELGSFPAMKKEGNIYGKSSFVKTIANQDIKIEALRNCSMLTVAPTGSISSLLNISSGIEPNFRLKYKRKTIAINNTETVYDVEAGIVDEYRQITGNTGNLPDYFVTSDQIHWHDRIMIQSIVQDFTDTGISSTINLPKTTTVEDIENLYLLAWEMGLKGITIYVDGSRDSILYTEDSQLQKYDSNVVKRPKELDAEWNLTTVKGKEFAIIVGLLNDKPYEVFGYKIQEEDDLPRTSFIKGKIIKIKKGEYKFVSPEFTVNNLHLRFEDIEERASTILSSMLLRHNASIEHVIKTLKKVNPIISSFTSALCRILNRYIKERKIINICPKCGAPLIYSGGCEHCSECEYSKCMLVYKERK